MAILVSFLNLLLYIAIVVLIAFLIRWLITGLLGWSIDANVEKWGRVVVILICAIAVVLWLSGLLGGGVGLPHFWRYG
jgi:uncharacterized membrane protein (DUF485 family)